MQQQLEDLVGEMWQSRDTGIGFIPEHIISIKHGDILYA